MTFGSTFGRTFSPTFQPKSQAKASAGAFVPTDITGCVLWYDFADADTMFTDAGATKVTADGNLIYQINDKSASAINATQPESLRRPAYKTNILNSKSAGYAASAATYYLYYGFPLGSATDFTIFIAANIVSFDSTYPGLFGGSWGAPTAHTQADGVTYIGTDSTYRIQTSAGFMSANANFLLAFTKSGTSSGNLKAYKNGGTAVVNTGKIAAAPVSESMGLFSYSTGYINAMKGYIYEYIIYNTALSDTDRGTVETYLNNKWAIY